MNNDFPPADPFPNCPGLSADLRLTQAPGPIPLFIVENGVRKRWYSICSIHGGPGNRDPDPACDMCMTGKYLASSETANKF